MAIFTITPETINEWRAELKRAAADVERLSKQIEVGESLLGLDSDGEDEVDGSNMTAAIERIAKAGPPLTNTEMRQKLRELGFPEERLGNYYYTAVSRLAVRRRISIGDDKKIGAAP